MLSFFNLLLEGKRIVKEMNIETFKCLCGNCRRKISDSIHVTIVSGDGSVIVWIICKCSRKWKGTFHLPEDFDVVEKGLKNDKEKTN